MDGITMMLKGAGIDIPKMIGDFESLKSGVMETLHAIDLRLKAIDATQQQMLTLLQEQTAWQRKQEYKPGQVLSTQPPAQPPAQSVPLAPPPPPTQQTELPQQPHLVR